MNDEAEIRALIERWAKAVRDEDRAAIRTGHDPDVLMFDALLIGRVHGHLGNVLLVR